MNDPMTVSAPRSTSFAGARDLARALPLALAGGVMTTLATGPVMVALAGWLAPLLVLRFTRSLPARSSLPIALVVLGVAYALAWQGTFGIPAPALSLLGVVFFLPYLVDRLVTARLRGAAGMLAFPAAQVSLEYALSTLPLMGGQPLGTWASMAHAQAGQLPLLQLASLTGAAGVTFVVALTASVGAWAWGRGVRSPQALRALAALGLLLASVLGWGGWRLAAAPAAASTVRVAAIAVDNPALTVGVWNPVARGRPLTEDDVAAMRSRLGDLHDALFAASAREARAGAELVAWAEDNAIVFAADEAALVDRGRSLAREHGIHLFMGMVTLVTGEKAENKVVAVTPEGEVAFTYLKAFPTPWEASVRGDGVVRFLDTPFGRVGAAICYDFDHPTLLRQAGRSGADIMVAPADDGMQVPWLHAEMATFRAIENGFSLVRPVIGGRALAVDPYGRVLAQQDYGDGAYFAGGTHVLVANLPRAGVRTLYATLGDVLPLVSLVLLAAQVAAAARATPGSLRAPALAPARADATRRLLLP